MCNDCSRLADSPDQWGEQKLQTNTETCAYLAASHAIIVPELQAHLISGLSKGLQVNAVVHVALLERQQRLLVLVVHDPPTEAQHTDSLNILLTMPSRQRWMSFILALYVHSLAYMVTSSV